MTKEHLYIHTIDGTCEICGQVNSRIKYFYNLAKGFDEPIRFKAEVDTKDWVGIVGNQGM